VELPIVLRQPSCCLADQTECEVSNMYQRLKSFLWTDLRGRSVLPCCECCSLLWALAAFDADEAAAGLAVGLAAGLAAAALSFGVGVSASTLSAIEASIEQKSHAWHLQKWQCQWRFSKWQKSAHAL